MKLYKQINILSIVLSACATASQAQPAKPNAELIEKSTGLKGKYAEGETVFKVTYPRADIKAVSNGVMLTPPMGLTAWSAFTNNGHHSMVMGDIVLTEDQVNPVMSAALESGLEVTALHNHFFWDKPKVMFMHIGGMGDEAKLAHAVGQVFAKLKDTAANPVKVEQAEINPAKSTLDSKKIDEIIGSKGELTNGVYKVTIGRTAAMRGMKVGNAMGINTWAAFAGSDDKAVVDGDFAMLESEVQGVLKALRAANINIVAIHNHMTMEEPRYVFLHFWGIGSVKDLATGVRAALDTQAAK